MEWRAQLLPSSHPIYRTGGTPIKSAPLPLFPGISLQHSLSISVQTPPPSPYDAWHWSWIHNPNLFSQVSPSGLQSPLFCLSDLLAFGCQDEVPNPELCWILNPLDYAPFSKTFTGFQSSWHYTPKLGMQYPPWSGFKLLFRSHLRWFNFINMGP